LASSVDRRRQVSSGRPGECLGRIQFADDQLRHHTWTYDPGRLLANQPHPRGPGKTRRHPLFLAAIGRATPMLWSGPLRTRMGHSKPHDAQGVRGLAKSTLDLGRASPRGIREWCSRSGESRHSCPPGRGFGFGGAGNAQIAPATSPRVADIESAAHLRAQLAKQSDLV